MSNLYFISQLLYKKFPSNVIVQFIGTWCESGLGTHTPTPSLTHSLTHYTRAPTHTCMYLYVYVICICYMSTYVNVHVHTCMHICISVSMRGRACLCVYRSESESGSGMSPTWGLAYFVSPPTNLTDILSDPFHAVVYLVFILSVTFAVPTYPFPLTRSRLPVLCCGRLPHVGFLSECTHRPLGLIRSHRPSLHDRP